MPIYHYGYSETREVMNLNLMRNAVVALLAIDHIIRDDLRVVNSVENEIIPIRDDDDKRLRKISK